MKERDAGYERVFDAIVSEEAVLRDLYSPLLKRLEASEGSLKKLSFSVSREAAGGSLAGKLCLAASSTLPLPLSASSTYVDSAARKHQLGAGDHSLTMGQSYLSGFL